MYPRYSQSYYTIFLEDEHFPPMSYYTNMSLVENLINQISTNGLSGISNPQDFDLEDDTFAKLLEKQMANTSNIIDQSSSLGEMGIPAGLVIEPYENIEFSNTAQDQIEAVGFKNTTDTTFVEPIEIKEIDINDYFSNLLKASTENKDFMNFAKRQASNAYDIFSRNYITDAVDFADDIASRL